MNWDAIFDYIRIPAYMKPAARWMEECISFRKKKSFGKNTKETGQLVNVIARRDCFTRIF
jgi:hypothetical protein